MSRRAFGLVLGLFCLGQSAGAAVEPAASDPLQALPALQQALAAPDLPPRQALPLWRQQIAHLLALQNLSDAEQALAQALPLAAGLSREQAELQLSREPLPLPTMTITPRDDLFSYELSDFVLSDYAPWPHIKAPIAV